MEHSASPSVDNLTQAARDALDVRRVFGEAYTSGDAMIIPVAKIMGGSGMGFGGGGMPGPAKGTDAEHGAEDGKGDGHGDAGLGEGAGGGYGVRAKPLGVYEVKGGTIRFVPAIDVSRLATGGQILAGVAVIAWAFRRRRR